MAAERKGFFQDEHLQVEYTQTPSSAVQIRGLLDGKWDVALTAPDNVMAYVEKENADLFTFMVADLGLNQKLFVRPEISSWADLRGKNIGVDAVDTGFAFLVVRMLDRNGLKPGDYTFVSVGGNQSRAVRGHEIGQDGSWPAERTTRNRCAARRLQGAGHGGGAVPRVSGQQFGGNDQALGIDSL